MKDRSEAPGPKQLALAYLGAFCAADLETIESLLASDLVFVGPWLRTRSRAAYLRRLRSDPPDARARYRLLAAVEHGDEACLLYRYSKPGGALRIAQWTRCRDGEIVELRLLFEPAPSSSRRRDEL